MTIEGFAGETVSRIRGPDRSDGTLQLGANSIQNSNIVLKTDGYTSMKATLIGQNTDLTTGNFVTIEGFAGETVSRIRGPNRSDGTLQLGANLSQQSNIVLNADGSCSISKPLFVPQRSPTTYTINTFETFYEITNPPDLVSGLWSITIDAGMPDTPQFNVSTTAIWDSTSEKWIAGGSITVSITQGYISIAPTYNSNNPNLSKIYLTIRLLYIGRSSTTITVWFSCIHQFDIP